MTPDHWQHALVGDLFDLQLGKMLNKAAKEREPQFPYLGNKEVQWGRLDFSDLRTMHFNDREQRKFKLEPGDLLVCEGGEVGRAALWKGEFDCFYQKAIHRLRATSASIIPAFMFYFMRFAAHTALLKDLTSQSSIAHLTREKLALLEVPLPPLPEQRKIAAILSSVDEVIEKTEAVIESLQALKKAMMRELLTRGLPGRHTRFKQTEVGEIPEEWTETTVGQLAAFSGGHGFRPPDWSEVGLPIIRIQNLNGSQHFNRFAGAPDPKWVIEPGDLLFAWAGSRGASFGPCLWPGPRGVLNQHIHRIEARNIVNKEFLFFVLQEITREVEKRAHGFKQSLVHLKKGELTGHVVALPPLDEQREIVAALHSVQAREDRESAVLRQTLAAKQALMSVLLAGELRVTPDEDAA